MSLSTSTKRDSAHEPELPDLTDVEHVEEPGTPRRRPPAWAVGLAAGLAFTVTPIVVGFWPSNHMPPARALASGPCAASHYMAYHQMSSCSNDASGLGRFAGDVLVGGVVGGLAGPEGIPAGMLGGAITAVRPQ